MGAVQARRAAIALLARREHAAKELLSKLVQKGFSLSVASDAIAELAAEGLQSDMRFAEVYVRNAIAKGQGWMRIRAALRERGVAEGLVEEQRLAHEFDELAQVEQVRRKRFGATLPDDPKERARQARFLQYRGFSAEQIRRVLKQTD